MSTTGKLMPKCALRSMAATGHEETMVLTSRIGPQAVRLIVAKTALATRSPSFDEKPRDGERGPRRRDRLRQSPAPFPTRRDPRPVHAERGPRR